MLFHQPTFLALLGLIAGTQAAPEFRAGLGSSCPSSIDSSDSLPTFGGPVGAEKTLCKPKNFETGKVYSVQVGRPYIQGAGCHDVLSKMRNANSIGLCSFTWGPPFCADDGHGGTLLRVMVQAFTSADNVNEMLHAGYPELSFHCKD